MRKNILTLFLAVVITSALCCAQREARVIEFDQPKLTVFLPDSAEASSKALLACPGGGYSYVAKNHEGLDWAPFFNKLGLAYAVLEYSLPEGDPRIPLGDVEAAYKLMCDSAAVWGFSADSIGVMGSSAGGHLASSMATMKNNERHPVAFQILFYPVISMSPDLTHMGSHNKLLGQECGEVLARQYSSDLNVSTSTPPALLMLSSDDTVVAPGNSLAYYSALIRVGVPVTLISFPTGNHGWGANPKFIYHDEVCHIIADWFGKLR